MKFLEMTTRFINRVLKDLSRKACLFRAALSSLLFFSLLACTLNLPEKHFKLGEEYLLQGQFQRSAEEYSKVVELVPEDRMSLTALDRIADIQRTKLKNPKAAIEASRKKFQLATEAEAKISALRMIASIYREDLEDPKKAAEEYQRIHEEFGAEAKQADVLLLEFAEVLREAQLYNEAATRYQDFLNRFPGHQEGPRVLLSMGLSLLSADNLTQSEEILKKVLSQFDGRPEFGSLVAEANFGLGNVYEEKDDLDKAIEFYKIASGAYPNPAVVDLKIKALEKRKKDQDI